MEIKFDLEFKDNMSKLADSMSENLKKFNRTGILIGAYGGFFDSFARRLINYTPSDIVLLIDKERERLRLEVEECNKFYKSIPYKPLSELFGVPLLSLEYPKEKAKTADEIISAKKNNKPFYKKLDKLKKWEK